MADYTITASAVKQVTPGAAQATAGESLTQGVLIYKDSAGNARAADTSSATKANVIGLTLTAADTGQPVLYARDGEVDVQTSAFTDTGTVLVLSPTTGAGAMAPESDLTGGTDYLTIVGYIKTTSRIVLNIVATGIQKMPAP